MPVDKYVRNDDAERYQVYEEGIKRCGSRG